MFSVKLTNTVNGIATSIVGANDTRATNQRLLQELPPLKRPRKMNLTASADIANNPPTACIGPGQALAALRSPATTALAP